MKLIVTLPNKILLEQDVDKLLVEDAYGSFCLLAEHLDMATALSQGILTITHKNKNTYMAIDSGFLAKQDKCVYISIKNALIVKNLRTLQSDDYDPQILQEEILEAE